MTKDQIDVEPVFFFFDIKILINKIREGETREGFQNLFYWLTTEGHRPFYWSGFQASHPNYIYTARAWTRKRATRKMQRHMDRTNGGNRLDGHLGVD